MIHIPDIESQALVPVHCVSPVDLRPSGETGPDLVAAQTAIVVGAAVGTGLCVAATGGLCLAATPFIGGLAGTATYSVSSGQHTAGGYAQAFGEGGLVGSLALVCATGACRIAAAAVGIDLAIGAGQGIYDYSQSSGCHSFGGYVDASRVRQYELSDEDP